MSELKKKRKIRVKMKSRLVINQFVTNFNNLTHFFIHHRIYLVINQYNFNIQ